jgi:hypothetical protein
MYPSSLISRFRGGKLGTIIDAQGTKLDEAVAGEPDFAPLHRMRQSGKPNRRWRTLEQLELTRFLEIQPQCSTDPGHLCVDEQGESHRRIGESGDLKACR